MKTLSTIAAILIATTAATAQTQLVRGEVDSVSGTNRFVLDCTRIPLVSATVDLRALHDATRQQDLFVEMQVRNAGSPSQPVLDVVSATIRPETFDMGNLRFGRSESWEVFGVPGSPAWVFVNHRSQTGYLPLGAAGTWLLGNALPIRNGTISGVGRFRFEFTMPTLPALVGQEFSAQAIVQENGVFRITEPDCKEVRND